MWLVSDLLLCSSYRMHLHASSLSDCNCVVCKCKIAVQSVAAVQLMNKQADLK